MDLRSYFPYLPPDENNEHKQQLRCYELNEATEKIKRTYNSLIFKLRKDIMDNHSMDDVSTLLITEDKSQYENIVSKCACLDDFFKLLPDVCSFVDYGLVKILVRILGSTTTKKKLESYKKKLQDFCKRRICELPEGALVDNENSGVSEIPHKVYKIKIDESLERLHIHKVGNLQYKMKMILGHDLQLLHISEGCVELTFRSFKNADLMATAQQKKRDLSKLGVLSISCGDVSLKFSKEDINGKSH